MRIQRKVVTLLLILICAILQGTLFKALSYLCIGYAAGCCCKLFYDEELRVPIILTAAGDLVYGGLLYGMQYLMRGRVQFYYYFGRIIIPEMIYTVLMTVLLYRLLFNINKRLTELEMKERDSIWLRK